MKTLILLALLTLSHITFGQISSSITFDNGTNIDVQSGADICADSIFINGTYSGGGTKCASALPVILKSFNFSTTKNNITLSWETEFELNNLGFDIERKDLKPGDKWGKISFVRSRGKSENQNYIFEDKELQTGKYKYRLKQIDLNGNYEYFELSDIIEIKPPENFCISQNYPNPFNPVSKIDYEIPHFTKVTIMIFDITGRVIFTLINKEQEGGYYNIEIDCSRLSSGVYFYRMQADDFVQVRKMILLK